VTPADLDALRIAAVQIARGAGAAIMAVYAGDFAVAHKSDRTPLTEADLAAHRYIAGALAALTPELPLLSEESAAIEWSQRREWRRYWLVDPLDGTREFVKRNGEFTVNIALVEDGVPILGVVHAPARGDMVHARRGAGAQRDLAHGSEPLQVRSAGTPLRVAGSRSHGDPRLAGFLERVGAHELVPLGSSLKFCLVAAGEADVYLRYGATSEWDTAAGQCIVEAAGGQVCDLAMQPLAYNRRDSLINPDFIACGAPAGNWREALAAQSARTA
jgi:3'(2'), 5'-bisphosphate nucleotidase